MGVVQGLAPTWEPDGATEHGVDVATVSLFLRAQASWLCQGLARAEDGTATGMVLGAHDASHETWLGLIATLERACGAEAAEAVAVLYGFHGRVVGSLERGLDRSLDPHVAGQVRSMLAGRLRDLTEEAIGAVNAALAR